MIDTIPISMQIQADFINITQPDILALTFHFRTFANMSAALDCPVMVTQTLNDIANSFASLIKRLENGNLKTKKESIEEPIFDYDMENGTVSYKFVQGKTIYNPFTNEYEPLINFPADETIATESQKAKKATRNDSIKRTIDKAFEIGCANDFRYFVTLTINKEKLNRYEPSEIYPALKNWLSNRVKVLDNGIM